MYLLDERNKHLKFGSRPTAVLCSVHGTMGSCISHARAAGHERPAAFQGGMGSSCSERQQGARLFSLDVTEEKVQTCG